MAVNPFIDKKSLEQVSEWVMNTPPPPQLVITPGWRPTNQTPRFGLFGGIYNSYARVMPTYNQSTAVTNISDKVYGPVNCKYPGGFWSQKILSDLGLPSPTETSKGLSDTVKNSIKQYLLSVPINTKIENQVSLANTETWFMTLNPVTAQITNNTTISIDKGPWWEAIVNYEGVCQNCFETADDTVAEHCVSLQLSIRPIVINSNAQYTMSTGLLVNSLKWILKVVTVENNDIDYARTENLSISSTSTINSHAFPIDMTSVK